MRCRGFFLICRLLCGVLEWVAVGPIPVNGQQLSFQNYSLRHGLLSNTSYIFFQDRAGYLWIATDSGVSRFDGRQFTNYTTASDRQPLGIILSFAQTADGHIWAGGNGSGLFEFDGKAFRHYSLGDLPATNLVTALCEIEPNVLLIGTEQGIFIRRSGRIRPVLPDARLMRTYKFQAAGDFFKTSDGRVVVLLGGNLHYLNVSKGTLSPALPHPRPDDHFDWIATLTNNRLAIGCANQQRVYVFRGDQLVNTIILPTDSPPDFAVETGNGALWIATPKGFWKADLSGSLVTNGEWINTKNGLPFSTATTAFLDRDRTLWIGSWGKGIYKLDESETYRFSYPFAAGLACSDTHQNLWFSSPDGLRMISRQANGSRVEQTIEPLPDRYAKSMGAVHVLPDQQLWLGTDDGHIANFRIEEQTNKTIKLHFRRELGPRTGFPTLKPSWIFRDTKGRLWVCEQNKPVLYVLDISRDVPYVIKKIIFDRSKTTRLTNRRHLYEDKNGNFWLTYERNQVLVIDPQLRLKQAIRFRTNGQLVDVNSVYQDSTGGFWFSTDNHGLVRYTPDGRLDRVSQTDGLLSDRTIQVTGGPNHTILAATWLGIATIRYNGDTLHITENRDITESPVWSLGVWPDGTSWIATNFEVVFRQKPLAHPLFRPVCSLDKVVINGRAFPADTTELSLDWDENNLIFEYSAAYLQNWGNLRFRWKLDGSPQQDWSAPSTLSSVNFAGLKPGRYTFWVKAITTDGLESPAPARFVFAIIPPLWKQGWFILFLVAATGSLTIFLIRLRVRRLLDIERLRATIAADLHDDIGSGLTRIALTSELLLRQKTGETDLQGLYLRIGTTSRELIEAMSDIVWSIDPKNDTLDRVTERLSVFALDLCEAKGVTCLRSFTIPDAVRSRPLGSAIVSSLVLIAKEALTNSIRHAQCRQLSLTIDYSMQQLSLTVIDDGTGFDENQLSRRNGLLNMRRRAQKAGGQVEIISSPERGTQVQLRFTVA